MKTVIVRYKVKADRLAEHEGLIHSVFEQLKEQKPAGLRYEVIRSGEGGLNFTHVATIAAVPNPLLALTAFKDFSADIKGRCDEPPVSTEGSRAFAFTSE